MKLRPRTPAVAQPSGAQLQPGKSTAASPQAAKVQKAKIQKAPRTSRPVKKKPTTTERPGADVVATSRPGWQSLPAEIKLMIAEEMIRLCHRPTRLCDMASLCREVQEVVEKKTFSSLQLSSKADILRLGKASRGASKVGKNVRKIHLHTKLRSFGHDSCCAEENQATIDENNQVFNSQISSLFKVLCGWESTSLTLELSVFSISDKRYRWRRNPRERYDFGLYSACRRAHSPPPMSRGPLQRIIGSVLDVGDDLPEVPAVTRFIVSRGNIRSLSPATVAKLIKRLPRLQDVIYEPWRGLDEEGQNKPNAAVGALLDGLQSHSSIKNVSIWKAEDKLELLHRRARNPDLDLALAAAKLSQRLESISASFFFDALDFFSCCESLPLSSWPNLESIALTSEVIGESRTPEAVDNLVLKAGQVALRMPKLRLMELWYSDGDISNWFLFRYEIVDQRPKVTIQIPTRELILSRTARELWSLVAASVPGSGLEVEGATPMRYSDWEPCDAITKLRSNVRHKIRKRR